MNKKINYGMIISIILVIVLMIGGVGYVNTTSDLKNTIQDRDEVIYDKDNALLVKDTEISNLANEITTLSQKVIAIETTDAGVIETIIETVGYLIDEIKINEDVKEDLTDREITLFDGEVEFNGSDYSAEEIVILKGLTLTANEEDFNSDVYSVLGADDIEYKFNIYNIEETFEVGDYDDDEKLSFNFLGEKVDVISKSEEEITFVSASKLLVNEGESVSIDNANIVVEMVSDDGASALVTVNADSKIVKSGRSKTIGGIDVYVSDIFYRDNGNSRIYLYVGTDIMQTVEDGEEYEEDSIWNWKITTDSIGLILSEDFKELDDDNKPLGAGDSICLPNDYVCVKFNGLVEEKYNDYTFEKDGNDVEIKGNFVINHEDVDEVIFNGVNFSYEDKNGDDQIVDNVTLEDSNMVLTGDTTSLKIDDLSLSIAFNMSEVIVNGVNVSQEEDYRSNYGIVLYNTEDMVKDKELKISIPEERVTGSFLVY